MHSSLGGRPKKLKKCHLYDQLYVGYAGFFETKYC